MCYKISGDHKEVNFFMADHQYKTGENAPETGIYKVDSLVNGGRSNDGNTTIEIEKGDQFPPSPSANEAAYWVKT